MIILHLFAIAAMVSFTAGLAEAKKRPVAESPARFLCENLQIGCVKKTARHKARKSKAKKAAAKLVTKPPAKPRTLVSAKPLAKPDLKVGPKGQLAVAPPIKPAPVKPSPKPEPKSAQEAEPKTTQPKQQLAVIAPAKPLVKPGGVTAVPPESGPPADEGSTCRADLVKLGADIEMAPAMVADTACVVANPVALKSLHTPTGTISLPGKPVFNCIFARQFLTWLGDVAAPVVYAQENAALAAVSTGPGFQCRGRNGDSSSKLSEHGFGNAVDIDAIVLTNKKRIEIASVSDSANPAHRLLMALRISACGYFTTVLGPGSNAAHATHYHFDLGIHGKSSNYRICE